MINLNQSSTKRYLPQGLKILLPIIAVLSLLGFTDASYLTADHYLSLPLPCTLNGCDVVLTSKYATVGPIPIAAIGIIYYLTVLFLTVHIYTSNRDTKDIARISLGITALGMIASLSLIYLQIFVIHSLCMYCIGSALITTLLLALNFTVVLLLGRPQSTP